MSAVVTSDRLLTISIDDGHPSDLRTAELLGELGLKATFYVSPRNEEHARLLQKPQLRELAERFEIGGHTYNHAVLTRISVSDARAEIVDGKAWLEDVLGQPVTSFCYPRGKFNRTVVRLVKEAGFTGARTTWSDRLELPKDPFVAGVTTQAYSHPLRIHVRHALLERNTRGLINFVRLFHGGLDWCNRVERAAQIVSLRGGVVHLWFHSWEIDRRGEWADLRRVLACVSDEYQLVPITNGTLFRLAGRGTTTDGQAVSVR